jgi:hypothetical protein
MKPKTKTVEIGDAKYQIRKLSPDIGSFILMQSIRAAMKSGNMAGAPSGGTQAVEEVPEAERNPEDIVRAVANAAFLGGFDFETHRFVQTSCLAACSRLEIAEAPGGVEIPMPIVNSFGAWAILEIRDDVALVMRLAVECMVFNFSDFFSEGGLAMLAGTQASTQ